MWFVKGGRASGKTTLLLRHSALTGTPILVSNSMKADILMDRAQEMGLYIPAPIVWNGSRYGEAGAGVLVDGGEELIDRMLQAQMGVRCEGMTIRGPLTVLESPIPKEVARTLPPDMLKKLDFERYVNGAWDGGFRCCARGNGKSHFCAGIGSEQEEDDESD